MKKIVVSGGTGFIGKALVQSLLEKGYIVHLLTRQDIPAARSNLKVWQWDSKTVGDWLEAVDGAAGIINLAGASIAERWTPTYKNEIIRSRVRSTETLIAAIEKVSEKPKVLINASAVGYYGHVVGGDVTESHPHGTGFLADVGVAWEKSARKVEAFETRLVLLRIGVVLEKNGGMLEKMLPQYQMFLGGPLGSGDQWLSWIHRDDVIGIILFALENQNLSGAINVTAPHPVTVAEFGQALGRVLKRPSWLPAPAFALKMVLGEMSEMLLSGQKAIPQKVLNMGYSFIYPKIDVALQNILD